MSNPSSLQPAYLNAETLQLLDESLESIQKRKQYAGSAIADALQRQMVTLIEQVDPEETARQLFGVGIISEKDVENATNKYDFVEASVAVEMRLADISAFLAGFTHICHILQGSGQGV